MCVNERMSHKSGHRMKTFTPSTCNNNNKMKVITSISSEFCDVDDMMDHTKQPQQREREWMNERRDELLLMRDERYQRRHILRNRSTME